MADPLPDTRSESVVRQILREVGPVLGHEQLRLLMAGDEFDTWALGNDLVVKFPRSLDMAAKTGPERAFVEVVRRRLPDLVPEIRLVSESTPSFPLPFLGYAPATGIQGQTVTGDVVHPDSGARAALAADVAEALTALHATPVAEAVMSGLEERAFSLKDRDHRSDATIARAVAVAGEEARRFIESRPTLLPFEGEAVPCHVDLKGEHVFVSPQLDRLTAVIDWADAAICDPARDLAGLVIWLGPSFLRQVVDAGPWDDEAFHRALLLSRAALLDYLDAVSTGEVTLSARVIDGQLRAAFSPVV